MEFVDNDGKWIVENGFKILIEASDEWTNKNRTVTPEKARKQILQRLLKLDAIVPRIFEDIIEQGKFNLHESKIKIIEEKRLLRSQL